MKRNDFIVRPAIPADAVAMADVQNEIFVAGFRKTPTTLQKVIESYLDNKCRIQCTVAVEENGGLLGFQSLQLARESNPYGVEIGWGIIGTHVRPSAARRGVGSALFEATLDAARKSALKNIDASIGADNVLGQAYYEAMGFKTYRTPDGLVCKVYIVD